MTIDEIRTLLNANGLSPSMDDQVAAGQLACSEGREVTYSFHEGWDILKAHICDRRWGAFNMELLTYVQEKYDEANRAEIIGQLQLEDSHWDWLKKSAILKSDEYRWFFIFAEGLPQAACVIYHPKKSALEAGNVFYIEYVAVAPWNRPNPLKDRFLKGAGTQIIRHAIEYAIGTLNLKPGFCLHALPKAIGFYTKIGMVPHPPFDKDGLPYFEMSSQALNQFMEKQ